MADHEHLVVAGLLRREGCVLLCHAHRDAAGIRTRGSLADTRLLRLIEAVLARPDVLGACAARSLAPSRASFRARRT